jgi:hypothetical protein
VERDGVDRSERAREGRRDVERTPAREARPARQPDVSPRAEPRPSRPEVQRSSPPAQDRGGSRPSGDGGRRRR